MVLEGMPRLQKGRLFTLLISAGIAFLLTYNIVTQSSPSTCRPDSEKHRRNSTKDGRAVSARLIPASSDLVANCKPKSRSVTDCKALFRGESATIVPNKEPSPKECHLDSLVQNCSFFRLAHGYDSAPVTAEETENPIAFSIKVHTNPEQFEQLFRTVYRAHNVFCIHVDKKSDRSIHESIARIADCFQNVHVIQNPINLVYASFAHVEIEMQLMKLCMSKNKKWKYYINLTGQEFPLKTNLEMVHILKQLHGQNDIENYVLSFTRKKHHLQKVKIVNDKLVQTNETKEEFGYKLGIRKGSTYGIFSRDFINFLFEDDVAQQFIEYIKDITPPEELIWATLNSLPWAPGGYYVTLRHQDRQVLAKAVKWSLDIPRCEGEEVRGICILGGLDLPWLKDRHELFANKFDVKVDPVAIDCLEESLRERTRSPDLDHLQWDLYRHLRQVENPWYEEVSKAKSKAEYYRAKKQQWLEQSARKIPSL